jgi:hypothetical protein
MRHRVWVFDDDGIHTPSHTIGERRFAEVYAANRSRFRRNCFLIVVPNATLNHLAFDINDAVAAYRNGKLYSQRRDTKQRAFDPEPVIVCLEGGSVYMLTEKTG